MGKGPDAFRTISEVSAWLETPAHVLRFWETKFPQLRPVKRAGGRRYYRPDDMALLGGIKALLHEQGMTIKGVQKILRERGARFVADLSPDMPVGAIEGAAAEPEDSTGAESWPSVGGLPGLRLAFEAAAKDDEAEILIDPPDEAWGPGGASPPATPAQTLASAACWPAPAEAGPRPGQVVAEAGPSVGRAERGPPSGNSREAEDPPAAALPAPAGGPVAAESPVDGSAAAAQPAAALLAALAAADRGRLRERAARIAPLLARLEALRQGA